MLCTNCMTCVTMLQYVLLGAAVYTVYGVDLLLRTEPRATSGGLSCDCCAGNILVVPSKSAVGAELRI